MHVIKFAATCGADLIAFSLEILNGKLQFLCSDTLAEHYEYLVLHLTFDVVVNKANSIAC